MKNSDLLACFGLVALTAGLLFGTNALMAGKSGNTPPLPINPPPGIQTVGDIAVPYNQGNGPNPNPKHSSSGQLSTIKQELVSKDELES